MDTMERGAPPSERAESDSGWTLVAGIALGALGAYFLDAEQGRRRRARFADQISHAGRRLHDARDVTVRDVAHRATGLRAEIRRLFRHEKAPDEVLAERARSALGRCVSHPHAVRIAVSDGHAVVRGPILSDEAQPLCEAIGKIRGIRDVESQLELHDEPGRIPALQGGVHRDGMRSEWMQDNWSPTARLAAGAVGTCLLAGGMRSRGVPSLLLGLIGGGLVARAATNRSIASLAGASDEGIGVEKTIHVNAPVERVFAFWSDFRNFPSFMSRVREVELLDDTHSRWVVKGPGGVPVEWISEMGDVEDGRQIAWHSLDSAVSNAGIVRFIADERGGTRVDVRLAYSPPAGYLGHVVASLFGVDPKTALDADLMRMKTMIETGHPPHDAAKPGLRPRASATTH